MRRSVLPVLFLVGPTGSGKTELSLLAARRLGCEIISVDSMLVYKGMDIGTAKPSLSERHGVPHHLVDRISPRSSFSVHEHRKQALHAIEKIFQKGRLPLIVGGSGLYLRALWKGLSAHPGGDPRLRKQIEAQIQEKGLSSLYERLRSLDPVRAKGIHPHDQRRIVRALEIAELSGRPPSDWFREKESLEDLGFAVRVFGIRRDRADLYERIDRRVEGMFRKGLIREVKKLKKAGFSKTAGQALGYREILDYLKKRKGIPAGSSLFLIHLIQKRTRQFAKRQLTWFRHEGGIQWVDWKRGEPPLLVCDRIVKEAQAWLENELGWSSSSGRRKTETASARVTRKSRN